MTPTRPEEEIHGEKGKKASFGYGSGRADTSTPVSGVPAEQLERIPTSGDAYPPGHPSRNDSSVAGAGALGQAEPAAGVGSRGKVGDDEAGLAANTLGKGFTGDAAAALGGNPLKAAAMFLGRNKKKAFAGGGIAGGVIGGLMLLFGVAQGPFQFVHLAQMLQQFHFQSNEDFGDERSFRNMAYALTGQAQKSRLSIPGNYAANKWEKKLLKETGLRPVYSSTTRILTGFEIVDEDKALNKLLDVEEGSKTSAGLEGAMGKGAEITTAGEIGGQDTVRANGETLSGDTKVLSAKNTSYRERGKLVKTVGKLTGTNNMVSTVASRLLKKRGGVTFHPFRNVLYKGVDKLVDWRFDRRNQAAKEDKNGAKKGGIGAKNTQDTNDDDTPDSPDEADKAAAEAAQETIDEAAKETTKTAIKNIITRVGGGAAAVGILCAAKGFGNAVPDYKYANNVLPMMRMGMRAVTMGNQVMSGDDVNLDELGAFEEVLYDKDNKTSWTQAATIQGELGQRQSGPKTPPEASLQNVNDKPIFFDILDKIPFLGTACSISGAIGDIPLVGDVLDFTSEAVISGINVAAGAAGTSVNEIMEGALAMVSGNAVNTLAGGAEYGNLANTGTFLAANDNAVSMGGSPLTNAQLAELKMYEQQDRNDENKTKSFAQRYLDPYSSSSLTGKLIDNTPASVNSVADVFTSGIGLFTGSFAKLLPFGSNSLVGAAGNVDYGVPKFGFSLADQENPKFENPYDNADIVEPHLDELNDKYGKPCFGMTVTAAADGLNIETEAMGSDDLNVFKVLDQGKCTQNSGELASDTNSQKQGNGFWSKLAFWHDNKAYAEESHDDVDPMFKRYRFYLADAISNASAACYMSGGDSEGEKYCKMLGANSVSASDDGGGGSVAVSGDAQEVAQQILDNDKISLTCYDSSVEQDVKSTANGQPGTAGAPVHIQALQIVAALGENHELCVTAFESNGGGHETGSDHYSGRAVDIDTIDGQEAYQTITDYFDEIKDYSEGAVFLQGDCSGAKPAPDGMHREPGDACNHQHISVP